jgi:anti-anti-sigma regulatory factor
MISVTTDDNGSIRIEGEATVHEAVSLRQSLLACLDQQREDWTLDLKGLTAVDLAGIQLLIAFKRAAPLVRVHSCPPAIRRILEQTRLSTQLL